MNPMTAIAVPDRTSSDLLKRKPHCRENEKCMWDCTSQQRSWESSWDMNYEKKTRIEKSAYTQINISLTPCSVNF